MFLSNEEMKTHLYSENVDAISGGDETIMTAAIDSALQEAKGYLEAYDKDAIFSAEGANRNSLLLTFIKDIAAWHFLVLGNAGTEFKLRQDRYDRALIWFKSLRKGDVSADLPVQDPDTSGLIIFGSNPQKGQHF